MNVIDVMIVLMMMTNLQQGMVEKCKDLPSEKEAECAQEVIKEKSPYWNNSDGQISDLHKSIDNTYAVYWRLKSLGYDTKDMSRELAKSEEAIEAASRLRVLMYGKGEEQ